MPRRFSAENGIETYEDLEKNQDRAEQDIDYLKRDREMLRNELSEYPQRRRGGDPCGKRQDIGHIRQDTEA